MISLLNKNENKLTNALSRLLIIYKANNSNEKWNIKYKRWI